jgi:hypothetical protein
VKWVIHRRPKKYIPKTAFGEKSMYLREQGFLERELAAYKHAVGEGYYHCREAFEARVKEIMNRGV